MSNHQTIEAGGITAAELIKRHARYPRRLTALALERWLVAEGFATSAAGRLWPTARAVELADALELRPTG
jgi:hypothetical protein